MTVAIPLGGCASSSYMGIPLVQGGAEPELQQLVQRARSGDKQAQLELGIAFEEGVGIERDLEKARALYRLAATDSSGQIWVYSPSVGNDTSGRVIPISVGPKLDGLPEAKRRLALLDE